MDFLCLPRRIINSAKQNLSTTTLAKARGRAIKRAFRISRNYSNSMVARRWTSRLSVGILHWSCERPVELCARDEKLSHNLVIFLYSPAFEFHLIILVSDKWIFKSEPRMRWWARERDEIKQRTNDRVSENWKLDLSSRNLRLTSIN